MEEKKAEQRSKNRREAVGRAREEEKEKVTIWTLEQTIFLSSLARIKRVEMTA